MNAAAQTRLAVPADAAGIAAVHVQSWRETYTHLMPQSLIESRTVEKRLQLWQRALSEAQSCIYVVDDGEAGIVGFASGGPSRELSDQYDAELYAIYLLQSHQRRGQGRALMQAVAKDLAARGYRSMFLWVLADNTTKTFYAHLGGVPIAQKEEQIGDVSLSEIAYGWEDIRSL